MVALSSYVIQFENILFSQFCRSFTIHIHSSTKSLITSRYLAAVFVILSFVRFGFTSCVAMVFAIMQLQSTEECDLPCSQFDKKSHEDEEQGEQHRMETILTFYS